ncbi:MAG: Dabb family protein [Verrucomicrobiota bacterium]
MFIHSVYFWLKSDAPASAQRQLLADCREYLAKIPTVRQLWAGVPAMTPRVVVDNSYAVGLTVILDDAAGHDVYQEHPLHKEFGARNKPHWSRVQVYDAVE